MLDVDTSGAALVITASTSFHVLRRRLTLGSTLTESSALLWPGQLAEQGADVAAAKRVDEGGFSGGAVAEQLEFDAGQRLLVDGSGQ